MVQIIGVIILFLLAVFYLVRLMLKNFNPDKDGCSKGCGCEANDNSILSKVKLKNKL